MAIFLDTSEGSGVRYLLDRGDEYRVAVGANVTSTDSAAIRLSPLATGAFGQLTLVVAGIVNAAAQFQSSNGILVETLAASDKMTIAITESGIVKGGYNAINFGGLAQGALVTIENGGTIIGSSGIAHFGAYGQFVVRNSGLIFGESSGAAFSNAEQLVFRNTGRIISEDLALGASGGNDQVFNSGFISGDVQLGAGDDLYDGRGGQVIGLIDGRGGDDRFIPGAARDSIDGGVGEDLLDFRSTKGVKVALDGSFAGTRTAKDDVYTGIENIYGSLKGGDRLQGDAARNELFGFGGADTLSGGAERDALTGGAGRDRLTGGDGTDYFLFNRAREGGDVITDFQGSGPTLDYLILELSGFGLSGTFQQGWYREGRTSQARDRNDHFIFRTTDTTLWFDADGRGGRGPVLLANLQAGAELDWTQINPIIT